jgi:hypothetical protein
VCINTERETLMRTELKLVDAPATPLAGGMQHYDFKKNWTRKVMPHLGDKKFNDLLFRDLNKYTWGRWRYKSPPGTLPAGFVNIPWGSGFTHRGPVPRYMQYVVYGACHWLVNGYLRLAMLVVPDRPWRIITGPEHSTVWDGQNMVFDINYYSQGVTAAQTYEVAREGDSEELEPGKYRVCGQPEYWEREVEARKKAVAKRLQELLRRAS